MYYGSILNVEFGLYINLIVINGLYSNWHACAQLHAHVRTFHNICGTTSAVDLTCASRVLLTGDA